MRRDSLAVVLISPRNPLNIGAAARALSNFGFDDLRVVNPYEKAFHEAVSAVGGAAVLRAARSFDSVAEAIADCHTVVGTTAIGNRHLEHPLHGLEAAGGLIRVAPGKTALLFGSEKFGLSRDDIAYCHWLTRIPTGDRTPSMNLGQAVAVTLYELIRDTGQPRPAPDRRKPVSGSDAEQLTVMLLDVLEASGYTNRIVATSTDRKVRQFIRRMALTARDAPLLLGILRQILWKIRAGD